jgi:hypothetical protein
MAGITSHRRVNLIDNRLAERPLIQASVYRDYYSSELEEIEASWATSREKAVERGATAGLAPLEHSHWDWRKKADSVEAGHHMLVALELDGEIQGLMAIVRRPRRARSGASYVVHVDYLESAPWNLRGSVDPPRFLGVGTVLMVEAVRISVEEGFDGRVGLHSLPQAEAFCDKCGLTRFGEDPIYFDLVYYEFTGRNGVDWLSTLGESP